MLTNKEIISFWEKGKYENLSWEEKEKLKQMMKRWNEEARETKMVIRR